jgi:phytol kinase
MAPSILIRELLRKSIHVTSIIIVLVYVYMGKQIVLDMLIVYLAFILLIEHFRLSCGTKIPLLDFLYREKERSCMGGHVFFVLGSVIAIGVYSKEVAIASILMATLGDMVASLVGITVGKTTIKGTNKSLEGSAAEFFTNLVISSVLLQSFPVAFVMAAVATLAETWLSGIDDNLSIPVFAGFSAELMLLLIST